MGCEMGPSWWSGFVDELVKLAGLPQEEPAPRTRVPGLKQPRIATPRLNPELNAGGPSNPFRGNWQKLAGSRLRQAVAVVSKERSYLPGWVDHTLHLNGHPIGGMETMNGRVIGTSIDPQYQGLGLGKKLYGEVMRRLPNQELKSGGQVSEAAQRVWGSLEKTKGYTIDKVPGVEKVYGHRRVLEWAPGREGTALFTGRLPPQAAVKLAMELTPHQQLALGAATIGAGLYTLKRTASQLTDPHPAGIGAGAGARTVQRVLLPGTSRAQVEPPYASPY